MGGRRARSVGGQDEKGTARVSSCVFRRTTAWLTDKSPMSRPWNILALLFAVRTVMAFQFEAVAALAPMLMHEFGVSVAEIGFLIGLYMAPGVVLALPGGAIGKRCGDKQVVVCALALMTCGGLIMTFSNSWQLQLFGRVTAGIGGVLLNVLMSKMIIDWFTEREHATAMAIFVNSWPLGIALALVALPPLAISGGIFSAFLLTTALVAVGMAALAFLYPTPPARQISGPQNVGRPAAAPLLAVIVAGVIWGLFNGSFTMVFSFGPSMLHERGWSVAAAGSATSIVLWLVVFSVPLGGFLADRTGRHSAVLLGGLVAFAAMLLIAARADAVSTAFLILGLVCGLSSGPIMSLPARVLFPETRAVGMGIFFTLFYLVIVPAPWVGGYVARVAESSRVTFDLAAGMLVMSCAAYWLFQWLVAYHRRLKILGGRKPMVV
jgi:predicted MFS family arabinose efflux permease